MPAVAFSNNDIAVVAWTFDKHLDGCLGFAVHQIDGSGRETVLPALARFASQDKGLKLTTEQAPEGFPMDIAVERPEEFGPGLDPELLKLVQATAEIEVEEADSPGRAKATKATKKK